jgi:uncharacterized protein YggU (UPF0235/DUF167 family)
MRNLAIIIPILFLFGCYSPKKAEKDLNKAQITYPNLVAKKTSEWYPCGWAVVKMDSTERRHVQFMFDSLNREIIKITDTIEIAIKSTDTINAGNKELIKQLKTKLNNAKSFIAILQEKINQPIPIVYKTIRIEDSAKLKLSRDQIDYLNRSLEDYRIKYENRMNWLLWLLIAFIVSMLYMILKNKFG